MVASVERTPRAFPHDTDRYRATPREGERTRRAFYHDTGRYCETPYERERTRRAFYMRSTSSPLHLFTFSPLQRECARCAFYNCDSKCFVISLIQFNRSIEKSKNTTQPSTSKLWYTIGETVGGNNRKAVRMNSKALAGAAAALVCVAAMGAISPGPTSRASWKGPRTGRSREAR